MFKTMGNKYCISQVICILILVGSALMYDLPSESRLTGTEEEKPFGNCKIYTIGGSKNATETKPLQDGSELAFYPLTEEEVVLYFEMSIEDVIFRVTIEGSMFKLEKCSIHDRGCTVEDYSGLKHPDFMKAQEWNIIRVSVSPHQLAIYVGSVMVKTMSMNEFSSLGDMYWIVKYGFNQAPTKTKTAVKNTAQYLVQFKCKDFIPKDVREPSTHKSWGITPPDRYPKPTFKPDVNPYNTPPTPPKHNTYIPGRPYQPITDNYYSSAAPHVYKNEPHHAKMSKASYIGLIVGLVVLTLAIILIALLVYYCYKKRSSLAITDQTPLQGQKTTK